MKKSFILLCLAVLLIIFIAYYFLNKDECSKYPEMLESCGGYSCFQTHPVSGGTIKRKIIGVEEEKCVTIDQLLDNMVLTCRHPDASREALASFLIQARELESSNSKDVKAKLNKQFTKHPMKEAINNGWCVMSGAE